MDQTSKLLKNHCVNEIQFRYSVGKPLDERKLIRTSNDAADLLKDIYLDRIETCEEFWAILLDRGNRVKGCVRISTGGINGTVADPRMIFGIALRTLSSGLVLAHNHPSGQLRPSSEDIALTKKLREGAQLLDIVLQDHLIMTTEGYFSFADNGML